MNLIEAVLKLLKDGDLINKIASVLGIGEEQAGKAVSAAVPSILAGLAGAASKPGGASGIANAVSQLDPSQFDNAASHVAGGAEAAEQGGNLLGSILGGAGMGQLGSVLSRFTGINEGAIGKLLGLLGPIVLGAIGKNSKGLDAGSIGGLLAGQKDNIAAALPGGLGKMLGSAIPGLSGVLGSASDAVGSAAPTPANKAMNAPKEVQASGSSAMKWLIPALLVVAAILFLPKMLRKASDTAEVAKDQADGMVSATTESTKIISDASGLIKDATTNIASIKDEATATAAVPKLQDITTKLGGLTNLVAGLPAPLQKTVADALRPWVGKLRDVAQPVLALPIVGPRVKPTVDALLLQLDKLVPAE